MDSPPDADDCACARSALQDDERQGDRAKPKPEGLGLKSAIAEHGRPFEEEAVVFLPSVVEAAKRNYAKFYELNEDKVDEQGIGATSLGIAGWSDPNVFIADYEDIDRERNQHEDNCYCAFGIRGTCEVGIESAHNRQVMKIIIILGQSGSGRRAVIKAIAKTQGIEDDEALEQLYSGKLQKSLMVPTSLREVMRDIGLGDMLTLLHMLEVVETQQQIIMSGDAWRDLEFEVALDSGSVVHVCSRDDCPGYELAESPGSRRRREFLMGDGGTIPNQGQSKLNLTDDGRDIEYVIQIAAVTRPLMSVGKICDEGHNITFSAVMAVVRSSDGEELCWFHRKDGGLYVAKLKLRSPAGFGRQEKAAGDRTSIL